MKRLAIAKRLASNAGAHAWQRAAPRSRDTLSTFFAIWRTLSTWQAGTGSGYGIL